MRIVWRKKKPETPVIVPRVRPFDIPSKKEEVLTKLKGEVIQVEKVFNKETTQFHLWLKTKKQGKFIDPDGNMVVHISGGFASAPFVKVGDTVRIWYTTDRGFVDVRRFGVLLNKRDKSPNPDPTPEGTEGTRSVRMLPAPQSDIEVTPFSDEDRPQLRTGTRG